MPDGNEVLCHHTAAELQQGYAHQRLPQRAV
jgi:hypothetical protein